MNSEELMTLMRDWLREPTAAHWTDADCYRKLNSRQRFLSEIIINASTGFFQRSTTISYVSGTATYDLPKMCARVVKVERIDGTYPVEVEPITGSDEYRFIGNLILTPNSSSEGWLYEADAIRIAPQPASTITDALRVRYIKWQPMLHSGAASAVGASTITFPAAPARGSITAFTDAYEGMYVAITAGTGVGLLKKITAYNATTRVATVESAWGAGAPVAGSIYAITPELPERWHDLIAVGAAMDALKETKDDVTEVEGEYQRFESEFRTAMGIRQQQRPRRVHYIEP